MTSTSNLESALSWLHRSEQQIKNVLGNLKGSPRYAANAFLCKHHDDDGNDAAAGTGVAFIDAVLRSTIPTNNNIIFEIAGRPETGKTFTLLALAASYLVQTNTAKDSTPTAPVIIVDADYGIHMSHLVRSIRSAVLQKWQKGSKQQNHISLKNDLQMELEEEIAFHLGRTHIINLQNKEDFLMIFEILRSSLLQQQRHDLVFAAPPMLIIDSINTFEQSDRIQSDYGIPGTNDCIRQFQRLLSTNVICFASRIISNTNNYNELWKRTVTHTVTLERSNTSSSTCELYEFVALLPKPIFATVPFRIASGRIIS